MAWSQLAEFQTWECGPWIDRLTVRDAGQRLRAIGQGLGMPGLCPSRLRDYASSAPRHANIDFPVRPVEKEHRWQWMGHGKFDDISDGHDRFGPDFPISPWGATQAFLRDLCRKSGGALFRQVTDKTPLRGPYQPRAEERQEIVFWRACARGYGAVEPIAENDDLEPGGTG